MDMFALNGEALNGDAAPVIAASASLSGDSSLVAAGLRVLLGASAYGGSANFTAVAVRNVRPLANLSGDGALLAKPAHKQAGFAELLAGADVVSYVLTTVLAGADLEGGAVFLPIPASILGSSSQAAGATLVAGATRVQPGRASAEGNATSFTAVAKATRMVSSALEGGAALRMEAQRNNLVDGFVDFEGLSNFTLPDAGLLRSMAGAVLVGESGFAPDPTLVSFIRAALTASGDLVPVPDSRSVASAFSIAGSATFDAVATRTVLGVADMTGDSGVVAPALQGFAAACDLVGEAVIVTDPKLWAGVSIDSFNFADFTAEAAILRMAEAVLVGDGFELTASASQGFAAFADVFAGTDFDAEATAVRMAVAGATGDGGVTSAIATTIRPGLLLLAGSSTFGGVATARRMAILQVGGDASFDVDAFVIAMAEADLVGESELIPDSRTNAEAYDPPERTLRRPYIDRVMYRPFTDRLIRRAA